MAIVIPNKLWVKPFGAPDSAYVELTPYIMFNGLKWSRNDVEASDAGRTQDGYMHRHRVGIKIRLDASCKPLLADDMATVLQAVLPVTLTVRYFDPMYGGYRVANMYSNNITSDFLKMNTDGTQYWQNLQFPLIEL